MRLSRLLSLTRPCPTGNPFDGFYRQPPEDYIARRRKAINLLRAPDVASLFARHGIAARIIPSRVMEASRPDAIHPWWRERYDDSALFTQLALVAGPAA